MGARWRPAAGSRHGNVKKTVIDGHTFDSGREAQRYLGLKLLVRAGEIDGLELQPVIHIMIGGVPVLMKSGRYPKGRQMKYIADFKYRDHCYGGMVVYEDVKMQSGYRTEVYKIKRALVGAMGIEIRET